MGCDTQTRTHPVHAPRFNPRIHMVATNANNASSNANTFQSTHPYGVRQIRLRGTRLMAVVSIHAPAWGATSSLSRIPSNVAGVQSTHPCGVRQVGRIVGVGQVLFQSTHPHGVRRGASINRVVLLCFNPRTRMGCDTYRATASYPVPTFQSPHPHGVRPG